MRVPVDRVELHEVVEPARLDDLLPEVRAQGILTSVHVAPVREGWMVLDGAHRTSAARLLGHATVPAHVVVLRDDLPVPAWGMTLAPDLALLARDLDRGTGPAIASVQVPAGEEWLVRRPEAADPAHRVRLMRTLARLVHSRPYRRLVPGDPPLPEESSLTWVLPTWAELSAGVGAAGPLPAGVTRFGPLWTASCPGG